MSETHTCSACGAKYWGPACPLCNLKVRDHAGDSGMSRAELREKVETLEKCCDALKLVMDACLEADAGHVRLLMKNKHSIEALESTIADMQSAASQRMVENACIYERLDAALKRIELLERDMNDVHPNALSGCMTCNVVERNS